MRFGIGYDIHPLVPGRRLVLGGVAIPFTKGLGGWSDGDVLTHAVIDALLGAAAMGDIGRHFPSGDNRYRGISSLVLLREVATKLTAADWWVGNIDVTVVAGAPRLAGFIDGMRRNLGDTLGIAPGQVSIKASTTNGLGLIARGEGVAALAVALIDSAQTAG
jgi:2-C-methyl-D-erythritol 2,4-cyclodiphosphate synthase